MEINSVEISKDGETTQVPACQIQGHTIAVTGGWMKTARVHDEEWQSEGIGDTDAFVRSLRESPLNADVFTFVQKLSDKAVHLPFPQVSDNVAAVKITSYTDWWENKIPQETRKNIRRATKRGVEVRVVEFDDKLIEGIESIYNETPVRQGRRFWHYGKSREQIKHENSSYLEKAQFLGAFFEGELIGFLKMVFTDGVCTIMQILSKQQHTDKRPTNALLAKAIEICAERKMSYFLYGKYVYGSDADGPLTEFKRRNGFEPIYLPRYYIPLTIKGRLYTSLRLHEGYRKWLPAGVERFLRRVRSWLYQMRSAPTEKAGPICKVESAAEAD